MTKTTLPIRHPESLDHRGIRLRVQRSERDRFRAKYKARGPKRLLVGIVWKGESGGTKTPYAVNVLDWGPIFHVPGCAFVNLQSGDVRAELEAAIKGFGVQIANNEPSAQLEQPNTLAALISALDVVIAPESDAAAIAQALGVPVLAMVLPGHELTGTNPRVQVFERRSDGQWLDVIRDVGIALLDRSFRAKATEKKAPYLRSMAQAFSNMNKLDDAEALYRQLSLEPGLKPEALFQIAMLRKSEGKNEEALRLFDEAIKINSSFWHAFNGKGMTLAAMHRFEEAIEAYQLGLALNPQSGEMHNNLGTALRRIGRAADALPHYRQAQALLPSIASIRLNLASALDETGKPEKAIQEFSDLIKLEPQYIDAHHHRAQINLSIGNFKDGWPEFKWRLQRNTANVRHEHFPSPVWNGESLNGKRVLIWTEQGIGDEILTASMIPDAVETAGHVSVLCSERLVPLMRRSFPNATIDVRAEPLPDCATDPAIDCQMSLSELGAAFRNRFEDFPKRNRFLQEDSKRRDELRAKYQSRAPGALLVGLSWMSQQNYEVGWLKSQELRSWEPILKTPGIQFVNLQYGDRSADLLKVRDQMGISVLADDSIDPLKDMDSFAAQVAALDLVISISNTTVHTAGALGVPAWVLAAKGRGRFWYWFRDRTDSPWYPSLRFFNQSESGNWSDVVESCARSLKDWTSEKTATS